MREKFSFSKEEWKNYCRICKDEGKLSNRVIVAFDGSLSFLSSNASALLIDAICKCKKCNASFRSTSCTRSLCGSCCFGCDFHRSRCIFCHGTFDSSVDGDKNVCGDCACAVCARNKGLDECPNSACNSCCYGCVVHVSRCNVCGGSFGSYVNGSDLVCTRCTPKPPFDGLLGEWRSRRSHVAEGGGKSFGFYLCKLCKATWHSAHALPEFKQSCKKCIVGVLPLLMWVNTGPKKQRTSNDGVDPPHRHDLCEACKSLGDCTKRQRQPAAILSNAHYIRDEDFERYD